MTTLPDSTEVNQTGNLVTASIHTQEVTHHQMQAVVDECAQRMRYSSACNFIFDLEGVEFLASACLGALISFLQDVEHCRGRIVLANCHDNVAFLFRVTRLDSVFSLYDDTQTAAESF